jgi:hypothetical protein
MKKELKKLITHLNELLKPQKQQALVRIPVMVKKPGFKN